MFVLPVPLVGMGAAALDAATIAWAAAVVSNGGTVSAGRKTVVNTLVVGLKDDNVWTKLDRLWLFAAENQDAAQVDLVINAIVTESSSPVFVSDEGYHSAGVGKIESNLVPSTAGGLYTLNAAHHSIWSLNGTSQDLPLTTTTSGGDSNLFPRLLSDGKAYFRLNLNGGGGFAVADANGFYIANRSGASAIEGYKNGSSVGSDTPGASALDTGEFIFGNTNTNTFAAASIGGSLSSTDAANFYSRLRTYMTAVGVP